MYLESVDADNPLDQIHRFLLTGVAPIVANAFDRSLYIERLEAENSRLHEAMDSSRDLVGSGPAIARVKEQILRAAPTDATVLIQGESGTGKEVAAQCIHQNSKRKDAPFIAVNCGAIAESLRESELFGHERGAFTGAAAQRKGKIELANGGTLFLDEVAELSLAGQAALLRVLQERTFERVGGTRTIPVDVRIIAATNSDLEAAVKEGRFRQDLFFRLRVIAIRMPALRERPEDIVILATHFISKHAAIRRVSGFMLGAQALLSSYKWPGNVRELENTVMRALVLGTGESIRPEDLSESLTEGEPQQPVATGTTGTYQDQVNASKRAIIESALKQAGGNFYEAARKLDLHPTYLYRLAGNLKIPSE
jgi:DNA-binding NtrC family response regulator